MKTINDIPDGKIFMACSACLAVYADALSWANANPSRITKDPKEAKHIIVLSCQVTELAILNDLRTAEKYEEEHPGAIVYISGCLAERSDIEFKFERMHQMRVDYEPIKDKSLVHFEKPFWIPYFQESPGKDLVQGALFRYHYPLRIGKGCPFNCTYCTIRITRGKFRTYEINEALEKEFLENDKVVLTADSPTADQIKAWAETATKHNKPISIRNIEPQVAIKCIEEICTLIGKGLVDIFHCAVQSTDVEVLKDMGRDFDATLRMLAIFKEMKGADVITATNIIVDYKGFPNKFNDVYNTFDYVSWNPYWDGVWDREKAEKRYAKYFDF